MACVWSCGWMSAQDPLLNAKFAEKGRLPGFVADMWKDGLKHMHS